MSWDWIAAGINEDAKLLLDAREVEVDGQEEGNFLDPTVFDDVNPEYDYRP